MIFVKLKAAVAASILLSLAGCAGFTDVRTQVASDAQLAQERTREMVPAAASKGLPANIRQRPRIAGEMVSLDRNALPKSFNQPYTYRTNGSQSISQVAQTLAGQLGIQVRVLHTAGATTGPTVGRGTPSQDAGGSLDLDWRDKPLKGLFDQMAVQQGLYWRYTAARGVEFFEQESRVFHVNVPSGVKKIDASISLGGGGGGGGSAGGAGGGAAGGGGGSSGGGSVNIATSGDIDPYKAMMDSINAMLSVEEKDSTPAGQSSGGGGVSRSATGGASAGGGGAGGAGAGGGGSRGGGRVIASPEMGVITVTARPPTLDRIAEYVDAINRRYAQNVQIDLTIYSVKLSKQSQAGFSADLVYKNMEGQGLNIVGNPILSPANGTPSQLTVSAGPGRFSGSKLVMQALDGLGDVALVSTGHVMAINGQPAPLQVADQITYLASSSTTSAPNVGTTTTLQPGTITAGFTANFIPLILSDNRILLQYQLQLSNATLSTVTSGNSSIQTPLKSEQSLQQQAYVRDGQSIVLMSFEQRRGADDRQLGLLGASAKVNADRNLLVVVMTVSTRNTMGADGV